MYEAANPCAENNQTSSGNGTVDESSIDPTGLLGKLKILIKETEEETAERHKRRAKNEIEQEYGKEKFVSKDTKMRLAEFTEWTTILENENDRLKEEIGKKSEASNDHRDLEKSNDESIIDYLKRENATLHQVCNEISSVNKEWQNYNKEVQLYIRQLEKAVLERNLGKSGAFLEEQWLIPRERSTLGAKEEADVPLLTRYNNLLKEACQLQKELEISRRTAERFRNELEELRLESSESIRLLNCQLEFYKEDYEEERREKRAAQATSTELSKELNNVRSQLRECQRRLKEVREMSRTVNVKTSHESPGFTFNLIDRKGSSSRRDCHLSADDSASDPVIPDPSICDEKDEETHPERVSAYECPGCGKTFPSDRSAEYLVHYEECQRTEES